MSYFYCESESPCVPATIHSYDSPRHGLGHFEIESSSPDFLEVFRHAPGKERELLAFTKIQQNATTIV